jgi:quinolinate synthase
MDEYYNRINKLKKEKDAIIIAHNYQNEEVQGIADFVGDSFALSKIAKEIDNNVIVFCGVHFMAETAKILSPQKKVLLPVKDAGCPMADMVTAKDIKELRIKNPNAAVVCYVNTSAAVKAESDIACTSSNAVSVVKSLNNKEIIFVPDENLGTYIAKQVPEKKIIIYNGYCATHKIVTQEDVVKARKAVSDAELLVHPECRPEVSEMADFVGSTSQIIDYAENSDNKKFIIGTEQGVLFWLKNRNPDKKFYILSPKMICPNMKKTNLRDIESALENMSYEITLDNEVIERASHSLNRMLDIK